MLKDVMDDSAENLSRLRKVFDICDQKGQGYITVEHFAELAQEHFGAERTQDVSDIISLLDQTRNGRIYFDEFVSGIKQILELKIPGSPDVVQFEAGTLFSSHMGSEETLVPTVDQDSITSSAHDRSEVSTFNEYDLLTDEDQSSATAVRRLTPTIHMVDDDTESAISAPSVDSRGYRSGCEMTDEDGEHYEDFGECQTASAAEDSLSNNSSLFVPQSARKLSSNALASHLFRSSDTSVVVKPFGDDVYDDIDDDISHLNDKVQRLESQLVLLNDKQKTGDEKHGKLREENSFLVERVHVLEEALRDVESCSKTNNNDELGKYTNRSERDRSQEIEVLTQSLQHLEREYQTLSDEAPRLRSEVDRLRRETSRSDDRIIELQSSVDRLSLENTTLNERIRNQRLDMEQERDLHSQLLDEMTRELDDLRKYKCMSDVMANNQHNNTHTQLMDTHDMKKQELELHVVQLKQENAKLREMNDDLNAEVTTLQVQHGRDIVNSTDIPQNASLATELSSLPYDELLQAMESLQEQHNKLRTYTDDLILRVMSANPALLEVSSPVSRKSKDPANKVPS